MNISVQIWATALMALSLTHGALAAGGKNPAESQVAKLGRAIENKAVAVAVFEYPDFNSRGSNWYTLKDGTSISEYLNRLSGAQGWHIMRLVQPIKGATDDLVFFKSFPSLGSTANFLPLPGSRWILFLNPAMEKGSKLRSSALYAAKDVADIPVIKPDTLFELYDGATGALCVQWPKDSGAGGSQVYPEELADDLKNICRSLSERGQKADVSGQASLKTQLGRDIARELDSTHGEAVP